MNKLEILLREHNEDVMKLVDNLYSEKYPKKKKSKTICHFEALGNIYDSDVFVRNYVQFIDHVSMIKPYTEIKKFMPKYITDNKEQFSEKCNDKNQSVKLKSGAFLKTYSPTDVKKSHIKKICEELLKCELNFID